MDSSSCTQVLMWLLNKSSWKSNEGKQAKSDFLMVVTLMIDRLRWDQTQNPKQGTDLSCSQWEKSAILRKGRLRVRFVILRHICLLTVHYMVSHKCHRTSVHFGDLIIIITDNLISFLCMNFPHSSWLYLDYILNCA